MIPDFSQLRKQQRDIEAWQGHHTSKRSLKSSDRKGFDHLKSSQQFDKKSTSISTGEANHDTTTPSKPQPRKKKRSKGISKYVVETLNDFLALWPHRFDYLYAPHPDPATKPDWQTESRHPLSDRLLVQGAYLYGVRPGSNTTYGLIDLDKGSPYHPRRDPLALTRIYEALEPLGLVAHLKLVSSDSLGLHIYFPVDEAVPSWQLGIAIAVLLENAGFKLMPGWLEVFPNRKPYSSDGSYSLFNGHRLPLQQGSYLLNDDLHPVSGSQQLFVHQWRQAAARNDLSTAVIEQTIKQAKRKAYRVTGKAQKFLNDLNAEIEPGWSGRGQTNHILGRIAMRSYIFGHVLDAESPLNGQALIDDIVKVAKALPGFRDYCGHRRDLRKRAKDYARAIENSQRYYPYASRKALKAQVGPTKNQQRAAEARENIRQATLDLLRQNALPDKSTARFELLCTYRISGSTLYKNRDLWHPDYVSEQLQQLVKEQEEKLLQKRARAATPTALAALEKNTSLLAPTACNVPINTALSASDSAESVQKKVTACNVPADAALSLTETEQTAEVVEHMPPPEQLSLNIQWALQIVRAKQQAQAEANQQQYRAHKRQRLAAAHLAQLQQWQDSGDPILIAEAERQLACLATTENKTRESR